MDGLSKREYEILVITSTAGTVAKTPEHAEFYEIVRKLHVRVKGRGGIYRLTVCRVTHFLGILLTFAREIMVDLLDTHFIDQQIQRFQPEVIYLGHIIPLSKTLIPYLAGCKKPVIFDDGGSTLVDAHENRGIWFKFLEEYASKFPILNSIRPLVIKGISIVSGHRIKPYWAWPDRMQIIFNSRFNFLAAIARGIPIKDARIIYSGLDADLFLYLTRSTFHSPIKIIVPGRIEPSKGQVDAVRLLAKLIEQGIEANLLLVGGNEKESYNSEIEYEINALDLEDRITVTPMVVQNKLVEMYHQADICFFPSYQKPGFSRTPLEAMACGCIVISYGNEGSDELIRDKQNGFLVMPEDYSGIVALIKKIISDPKLVNKIARAARKDIEEYYTMDRYVDRIEETVLNSGNRSLETR
jgi:glycosyltransferase involved in cell wall biosynthesis